MAYSDGKFQIQRGEGISQAIAREIGLTKEQCKYVDWQSVFEKVQSAKGAEGNSVNWGGGDTLTKEYTGKNYVVNTGDEFVFSTDSWESIYNEVETSLKNKNQDVEDLFKPESSVVSGIQDEQPEIVITEVEQDDTEQQAEIDSNEYDKKSRLSWGEIGTIACKSGKKFVKGMFCNKEGKFSIGRTALTVGVIVGCAVAAPLVAAGGAALLTAAGVTATTAATVANVAVGAAMLAPIAINGSKKVIEGASDYYNAETREDAVEAMEHGWDGGVELASIPVMGKMFKWGGKLLKLFKPKTKTDSKELVPVEKFENKPVESTRNAESSAGGAQSNKGNANSANAESSAGGAQSNKGNANSANAESSAGGAQSNKGNANSANAESNNSINKQTLDEIEAISKKLSGKNIKTEILNNEIEKLGKLLKLTNEDVALLKNKNKKTICKLLKKYHPDINQTMNATAVTTILTSLL